MRGFIRRALTNIVMYKLVCMHVCDDHQLLLTGDMGHRA